MYARPVELYALSRQRNQEWAADAVSVCCATVTQIAKLAHSTTELTMRFFDLLMLLAVLLSPLAAVQLSMWRERVRRAGERRLSIFQTLMATRTQRLGWTHVNALNMIDVEFYGEKKFAGVRGAWHAYLDSLASEPSEAMFVERDRLFYELLQSMGKALGYTFEITAIKQTAYIPVAHNEFEKDQRIVREGIIALLAGRLAIPIQVFESPPAGHVEAVAALQNSPSERRTLGSEPAKDPSESTS